MKEVIARIAIAFAFAVFSFTVSGCFTLALHERIWQAITSGCIAAVVTFSAIFVGLSREA